jgi:hypothetical protein
MCHCELSDGSHWFVDMINAPSMYQIAETPEQAEHFLRSWAGKILRIGHMHLDMRQTAAKILACKNINMISICNNYELHPANMWFE